MNENQIIDITLEMLFKNIGFKAFFQHFFKLEDDGIDGELHFIEPAGLPRFQIQVKRELRFYQIPALLERRNNQEFMVMAEKIFPTLKKELRNNNINYVDAAGNIFIKTGNQTIWIDGNKYKPLPKTGTNKAFNKTGLKAIFYLLINNEAINYPYRKLAEKAGIAVGNIKNIIDGLRETGFILPINEKTNKLINKKQLMERWVTAYGEILKPALLLGTYNFWDKKALGEWKALPIEYGETVWGGEPGGDLLTNNLKPQILTVYTTAGNIDLIRNWTLIPHEKGELRIYQKFWKDEAVDVNLYAPPLLVYADLLLTNDPRCHETANIIFDKYLKNEFERN